MSIQSTSHLPLTSLLGIYALLAWATPLPAAASEDGRTPPGIVDFAGRVARNYWHLFGPDARADLEAINRELPASTAALNTLAGIEVESVAVGLARVRLDPAVTPESRVVEAIQNAGYAARKQYAR